MNINQTPGAAGLLDFNMPIIQCYDGESELGSKLALAIMIPRGKVFKKID